jgi:glyoxylase-like metal-dependent hydrolase (beta-lactamase superfamily II)
MTAGRWRETYRAGDRTVLGVSDGTFTMSEGFMNVAGYHERLEGGPVLPIASFVVPGEQTVLLDAGYGPRQSRSLKGGALLDELEAIGVRPDDVDVIAVSHLHFDHDGWLATTDAEPVFANATIHVGRADYEHFVLESDGSNRFAMAGHLKAALIERLDAGRLVLVDDTTEVVPGVVALPAPGHTPGHMVFAIGDGDERLLVLGDAMYCPAQLTDMDLTAAHDVDPLIARRTREAIAREVERHATSAVGCHFPGLHAARLLGGEVVAGR